MVNVVGVWGIGVFENDDASDFGALVEEQTDLTLLEETVSENVEGYLEGSTGAKMLAAAEIVANLLAPRETLGGPPGTLLGWIHSIKMKPSRSLVQKAALAVTRVGRRPSELVDLWQEAGEFDEWKAALDDLKNRLISEE